MDGKRWTLIAVCAGTFMLLLAVTVVIVAQPAIRSGLHASFSDMQWTLDAYALTLAALLRGAVAAGLRSSFATAINDSLHITAGLVVGAVCAVVLIRREDFRPHGSTQETV